MPDRFTFNKDINVRSRPKTICLSQIATIWDNSPERQTPGDRVLAEATRPPGPPAVHITQWSQPSRWGIGRTKLKVGFCSENVPRRESAAAPPLFVLEWQGLKLLFLIWRWKYHFILLMPQAGLSSAETSLPKTRLKTSAEARGILLTASSVIFLLWCVCVDFLYQVHMWQSPHAVCLCELKAWRVQLFSLSVLWKSFFLTLWMNRVRLVKPRQSKFWSFWVVNDLTMGFAFMGTESAFSILVSHLNLCDLKSTFTDKTSHPMCLCSRHERELKSWA